MTRDYTRHGVTTLFAALDVLAGKVIGQCMKRHPAGRAGAVPASIEEAAITASEVLRSSDRLKDWLEHPHRRNGRLLMNRTTSEH